MNGTLFWFLLNKFDADAFAACAFLRPQESDLEGAIADFSAAILLKPPDGSFYAGRAFAYSSKNNSNATLADFAQSIAAR